MNELTVTSKLKAKDLRKSSKSAKQPCRICEKHELITELHHLVPLQDCAFYMNLTHVKKIEVPLIWLCPNCHAYVHAIFKALDKVNPNTIQNLSDNLSQQELKYIFDLWDKKFEILRKSIREDS